MQEPFLLVLLAATLAGATIHGITGFAFNMIFLSCVRYFLPYTDALALMSLLSLFVLITGVIIYRHHIVWRWLPIPLLSIVICTSLSVWVLQYISWFPYWYKLLGIIFILLALYMLFWQGKIKIRPTTGNALLFCGLGGIVQGLFGAGVPFITMYFLNVAEKKEEYQSTMQVLGFSIMLVDFLGRCASGMVTAVTVHYAALAVWMGFLGLWIGYRLFQCVNALLLKRIVCLIVLVNGVLMLFR